MKEYRKKGTTPMIPWSPYVSMLGVSVWEGDTPELGGMIASNPSDPFDMWYVSKSYFEENYEEA